jgi:hypothetical protein
MKQTPPGGTHRDSNREQFTGLGGGVLLTGRSGSASERKAMRSFRRPTLLPISIRA